MDLVSLQNQTRIWLGQVLGTRLDEDLHISDLLQDGEILFEVSKLVWERYWTQCMELNCGPFVSKRSKGRYRPYCNVDSFLKVCKILGMNGIDLFSPSDVVEKRDIRKVCTCIRALAKKARSKELSVPDFDVIMYSVAVSTVMVGEIRRSLESSPCTTPSSHVSYKNSPRKPMLNISDDSSYEESDEAESRFSENCFSSTSKFDVDGGEVSSERRGSPKEYASDSSSSALLDGMNNMFNFFLNVDSQGEERSDCGKNYEDDEMELSSTTNTSSILGRMLNTELGDTFDADESSEAPLSSVSFDSPENEFPQDIPLFEDKGNRTISHVEGATCDELGHKKVSTAECEKQDEITQNLDAPVKHTTETEINQAASSRKSGRMTLLKTIAKGTAIAGVLFLLSNFRKSIGTNNASQTKQPNEAPTTKESKFSPKKQQTGNRGKRIYPTEKLKL